MRDRWWIVAASVVLLALLSSPFWARAGARGTSGAPALDWPVEGTACIEPTVFMRRSHMRLLIEWREQVVRRQIRQYTAGDGRTWTASLTGTCLRCHANKAGFCDRCHAYAGVAPDCWNCHVDPAALPRGRS